MSSKPTQVPRWAQTAPNNWSGSFIDPLSGKKDTGFLAAERPPAEYLNWYMGRMFEWAQYLSDGDLEINGIMLPKIDAVIANAVETLYDPTLTGSLAGVGYVRLTGGGASAGLSGLIDDGTTANGRTIIFQNGTGSTFTLVHAYVGTPAQNQIWIPNISTLAADVSITVPINGTFALRYESAVSRWVLHWTSFPYDVASLEVLVIPAALANRNALHTEQFLNTYWASNGDNGVITYPITLPVGSVLRSWKLYCTKTSANPASITATLNDVASATQVSTPIGAAQSNNTTNPGAITLKATGLSTTFAVGHSYVLAVVGIGAALEDHMGDLEVSYTRTVTQPAWSYTP